MNKHLFSVIIPVREINDFIIHETLPALQAQTYPNFEVFIAPDKKQKIDAKLEHEYQFLKIIPTDVSKKPGDKRDAMIPYTKGDILAFIDDDVHPLPNWLENAAFVFEKDPTILALGGPGILPLNANRWEDIFDSVLTSPLGSGAYRYRFTPDKEQFVDDYPSMNLMMKTEIFTLIGGFQNAYWPGEDSKMLNRLRQRQACNILYNPNVQVYHHRRDSLSGHLKQHRSYGFTRGMFFAEGDTNSTNLMYLAPTFFTLYLFGLILLYLVQPLFNFRFLVYKISLIPLWLYLLLLAIVALNAFRKKTKWYILAGTFFVIPLTHLTYGIFFILGYCKSILSTLKII